MSCILEGKVVEFDKAVKVNDNWETQTFTGYLVDFYPSRSGGIIALVMLNDGSLQAVYHDELTIKESM